MKRAFIFANGRMDVPPSILTSLDAADLVIAADGGSHHCESLGITPHIIIGDFDSLDPQAINRYNKAGTRLIHYPARKDETDLELALLFAVDEGIDQVNIIGALGDRWDMTFANALLPAQPRFSGLSIKLFDGPQEISVLRGDGKVEFAGKIGCTLSLIPVGGDTSGITTHGLEYPLLDETLHFASPRGVSNSILADPAQVSLREGILLICLSHQTSM